MTCNLFLCDLSRSSSLASGFHHLSIVFVAFSNRARVTRETRPLHTHGTKTAINDDNMLHDAGRIQTNLNTFVCMSLYIPHKEKLCVQSYLEKGNCRGLAIETVLP